MQWNLNSNNPITHWQDHILDYKWARFETIFIKSHIRAGIVLTSQSIELALSESLQNLIILMQSL